ncbi:MAG: quinone oxidoreductase [Acidobacteriota bacterium]|jgi:NADPH2:quinone reductase|nr:quinone oxidoreductase [Acidobacteriota bacterium]MDQ3373116.1 quinone oxidoreductase [Acidobacteriota bacterium]
MKAIRINEFGGSQNLRVDEIEKPTPGADEVLIKTAAAGINYADTMLRQNKYMFSPELPFVLGFEVAGTIEAAGANVKHFSVGQRVLATVRGGGYAEYAIADWRMIVPIPDDLEFGKATALLVQGLTALGLLADLTSGQTILIHAAAGGVGSLLVQLAKHKGAKVLGTASTSEKLEKVVSLGADVGINYSESDWTDEVLAATDGKGVDLIIEMVGGEIGRQNFKCLATGGTMIVYGAASGEDFQISALSLLFRMQTVKGYNLNFETRENMAAFTKELMSHIAENRLEVNVTEFPLEQAKQAHDALEGRKTMGKVVLTVG